MRRRSIYFFINKNSIEPGVGGCEERINIKVWVESTTNVPVVAWKQNCIRKGTNPSHKEQGNWNEFRRIEHFI